jgi:hypothetical protein
MRLDRFDRKIDNLRDIAVALSPPAWISRQHRFNVRLATERERTRAIGISGRIGFLGGKVLRFKHLVPVAQARFMIRIVDNCAGKRGFVRWSSHGHGHIVALLHFADARDIDLKLEVGAMARLTENTTSSAVKGLPSWNFTPDRKLKRHTVGDTVVHETANSGASFQSLSRRMSAS